MNENTKKRLSFAEKPTWGDTLYTNTVKVKILNFNSYFFEVDHWESSQGYDSHS